MNAEQDVCVFVLVLKAGGVAGEGSVRLHPNLGKDPKAKSP